MKNKLIKFAGVAAVAMALVQSLQAVPITGSIGFAGNANLNTGTAQTATTVVSWSGATTANPTVQSDSGVIGTIVAPGTQVLFSSPWNFTVSSLINGFWASTGPGGVSFNLQSFSFTRSFSDGNWQVAIGGMGLLNANGYDATLWNFSVTFQDPASNPDTSTFTFSASQHAVPDGGTTVALLGIALAGVGLLRKKFAA